MNTSTVPPMTHIHWMRQQTPTAAVHFAIGIFMTVVAMAAFCSNVLVVFTCMRYKDLRTRSNILIINLAIGDLLMCTIDFPLLVAASFHNYWSFDGMVCQIYAFLTAVAGLVTINTLAVIAADRYWAVVRRPNPGQHLPKCVTASAVVLVWTYSLSWAICPILGWGAYILDGIGTTCTFDYLTRTWQNRSFVLGMITGNFLLPFSVMIFSYTRIWMAVREVKSGLERESSHVSMGQRRFSVESVTSDASVKPISERNNSTGSDFYHEVSRGSCDRDMNYNENYAHRGVQKGDRFSYRKKQRWSRRNSNQSTTDESTSVHKHNNSIIMSSVHFCETQNSRTVKTKSDFGVGECCTALPTKRSKKHFSSTGMSVSFVRHATAATEIYSTKQLAKINEQKFGNGDVDFTESYVSNHHRYTVNSLFSSRYEGTAFSKIRLRYYKTIGSKLFLKQHRYRLHCEHKTIKIIMFLLMAFTLSWTPYMVVSLIGLFGDQSKISYVTSAIPSLIAKTSTVFNPLLYSISHPKVRKRILKALCGFSPLQKTQRFHIHSQRFLSSVTANSQS
ncbi:Rhodopsin, GQ-coupled [Bulinus truncatus]|nr:Rhodopsin, GQ-coupled [Bulinus truncatus]